MVFYVQLKCINIWIKFIIFVIIIIIIIIIINDLTKDVCASKLHHRVHLSLQFFVPLV